jgi:beta-phosphoglucomutase
LEFKAVLFDFDGIIADTLTYHVRAWQINFIDYGVNIFPEDIYPLEGRRADEIARILAQKKGLSLSESELQEITKRKRATYRRITRAKVYPATEKLINSLKEKSVKLGLVTGSIISNMEPVVGSEFLKNFDVIVTGDDVANAKPNPEPYLTAAERLGVKSEECIVIENAPSGIKAAKNAGMYCIAVKTTIKDEDQLKEADLIVKDMSKIPVKKLLS